ncbi:MAG TPA: hypothetical protein VEL76_41145, partial [Gemmataceae bacterium]|nr:hypothetical protein [Gemmataceae bacterium]
MTSRSNSDVRLLLSPRGRLAYSPATAAVPARGADLGKDTTAPKEARATMRLFSWCGKKWLIVLGLLLVLGGVAWFHRTSLLTWYYLRGLTGASEQDRANWAERVAGLDEAVVPALLDYLTRNDAPLCANAEAALSALTRRWGLEDGRTLRLVEAIRERFATLSTTGKEAILELALVVLRPEDGKAVPPAPLADVGARLLSAAGWSADRGVRVRTLALAEVLIDRAPASALDFYRDLVNKGLADPDAESRVRAI